MRKHIKAFFKIQPTKTALRMAYILILLTPFLWWAEEAVYIRDRLVQRMPHESLASYHKVEEPGNPKTWCILTLTPIPPKTALDIAKAKTPMGESAKVVKSGLEQVDYRAKAGCNGVDESRMYWVLMDSTQKEHASSYLSFEVIMWIKRLIYMTLMVLSMGNIINRKKAKR